MWYFGLYTKDNPMRELEKFKSLRVTYVNHYASFTALNVLQYPFDGEVIYTLPTKVVLTFSFVFFFFRQIAYKLHKPDRNTQDAVLSALIEKLTYLAMI
jgi:hypothetical protein